ncbi:unnamed protein product [Lepidochelys kempii]
MTNLDQPENLIMNGVLVVIQEDLDMLLGSDLCAEEQDFLQKRKKVVAATLKKVLQLEEDLLDHEVSGGKWCEFSPYKVGFLKYAAFIRSEDFGSEFFMGRLMTKNPESWICYIEDCQLDLFPNQLTTSEDDLCLADAAYFINTSCPPLLRKERNVDIILSFDYSLSTAFEEG